MRRWNSSVYSDGVSLTRSVSIIDTDVNGIVTSLLANYIVTNCGTTDLIRLKLQGSLINKAQLIYSHDNDIGDAVIISKSTKTTNGNTVLTWTFKLLSEATHTFSAYYSV